MSEISKMDAAVGGLKSRPSYSIRGTQLHLDPTTNTWLKPPRVHKPKHKPSPKLQLHVEPINTRAPLVFKSPPAAITEQH